VQTGAWLRRGAFHALSRDTITSTGIGVFGMDALVGSVFVGGLLAVLAATGTYALVRGSGGDPMFADLVRRTSDRYLAGSITAWEFARGKLRMDPVYRAALCPDMLPPGGTLLDIGCGQGLTLALLVEARQAFVERRWPASWPEPPLFDRLVGIEARPRPAASARKALDGAAEVVHADARTLTLEPARAVLLFDVLQLLERDEQEALLGSLASRLDPAGVVLIREADPAVGWRFTAVRVGNGLKALVFRTRRTQAFNPRTQPEWRDCFARHGFVSETRSMGDRTPFANVLFRLTRAADASARSGRPALPA
jgi:SAM-dependent methyltransferase